MHDEILRPSLVTYPKIDIEIIYHEPYGHYVHYVHYRHYKYYNIMYITVIMNIMNMVDITNIIGSSTQHSTSNALYIRLYVSCR